MKKNRRLIYISDETEKQLHDTHWFFANKSDAISVAIYILYLIHTGRVEINWKKEKPITW